MARGALGVLVCAVALLALPATSAAKPGYAVSLPSFSIEARLPRSDGYRVSIGGGRGWFELVIGRGNESALYLARGKVDPKGIDVDLGRLGHLKARFVEQRRERGLGFPGCRGKRPIEVEGRLEGSFAFRGEGGYVTVSSTRAKASYTRYFKETCHFEPDDDKSEESIDLLEVRGKTQAGRRVELHADHLAGFGTPSILAATREKIGRVLALKYSQPNDKRSLLDFSLDAGLPQTAELSPTAPFHGSAFYSVQPDGTSDWSGDLRVSFLGIGSVPLTGDGFRADACRVRISSQSIACDLSRGSARETSTARLWRSAERVLGR